MHKKSNILSNGASDMMRGNQPYRDYTNKDKKSVNGQVRPSSKVFQTNNIITNSSKKNLNIFDKNYGKDASGLEAEQFDQYKDTYHDRNDSSFKSNIGHQIMSTGNKGRVPNAQNKVIRTQKHVSNKVQLDLSDDNESYNKYDFNDFRQHDPLPKDSKYNDNKDLEIMNLKRDLEIANKKIEVQTQEMEILESQNSVITNKYKSALETIKTLQEKLIEKEAEDEEKIEEAAMETMANRRREREMMMQFVMNNMMMVRETSSAEDEEQRMLQRVLEESKRDAGVDDSQPNPDEMTYEQLLELEANNGGSVSKGLSQDKIKNMPEKVWRKLSDTTKKEEQCSICFEKFERMQKIKELKGCNHAYHTKCIDKWLTSEKRCPVCNKNVI